MTLNGLMLDVGDEQMNVSFDDNLHLTLTHCTLFSGRTPDNESLTMPPISMRHTSEKVDNAARLSIRNSIVGPLWLTGKMDGLTVLDSIVDATTHDLDAISSD